MGPREVKNISQNQKFAKKFFFSVPRENLKAMFPRPYAQLQMVTPKAVHATVLYDGQVRLWFRRLCFTPEIEEKLRRSSADAPSLYRTYRNYSALMLTLVVTASALLAVAAAGSSTPLMALGTLAAAGTLYLAVRRRVPLARLSASLIEVDRAMVPPGMTLYQMGELYARTYRIPSLVDTIWLWDHWVRNALLVIYIAAFAVFFLPFWEMVAVTFLGCGIVVLLAKNRIMRQSRPETQAEKK